MGSPENEPGHKPDESPQHKVQIAPFWMGRCEVLVGRVRKLFMFPEKRKKKARPSARAITRCTFSAGCSFPPDDSLIVEMRLRHGKKGLSCHQHDPARRQHLLQMAQRERWAVLPLPPKPNGEYAAARSDLHAYSFRDDPRSWDELRSGSADNSWAKYQKSA
jgi:formylglycine-generating enzyme required for sulfatase activity